MWIAGAAGAQRDSGGDVSGLCRDVLGTEVSFSPGSWREPGEVGIVLRMPAPRRTQAVLLSSFARRRELTRLCPPAPLPRTGLQKLLSCARSTPCDERGRRLRVSDGPAPGAKRVLPSHTLSEGLSCTYRAADPRWRGQEMKAGDTYAESVKSVNTSCDQVRRTKRNMQSTYAARTRTERTRARRDPFQSNIPRFQI
jgi:hypothetical protein